MAGVINFANPNYHESQPFPIETPLAETVATNPAAAGAALPLLMSYIAQRNGAQSDYRDQIDQQHQMAAGALQENQANNARERIIDLMKLTNPGAIGAASTSPVTGPLFAGMDPTQLKGMNDYNNRMAMASIAEKTGRGAQGALAGGIQFDPGAVSSLTGLPTAPGTPPVAQAAGINAAGRVAAAGISRDATTTQYGPNGQVIGTNVTHKGGGAGPGLPSMTNLPQAPQSAQPGGGHITPQTLDAARIANPNAYRDIIAGGGKKNPATGNMVGKSGTEY